jgi:hypothetical protein
MDYDQLIKNWHAKASNEDYFSKFVFEYLAFTAFLRKKKFKDCKSDRCALQHLKQCAVKSAYLSKVQSDIGLKRSWEKIKKELERAPLGDVSGGGDAVEAVKWWNCSHLDFQSQTNEEKNRIKGIIHSFEDWENMVEFWGVVRNNLFHGGKNPEERRDNILVEHGFVTLRALMEILLVETN